MKASLFLTTLILPATLMAGSDNALGIRFSKKMPGDQINMMNRDLAILTGLKVEDPDQSALKLFNMDINGANYAAWLAQRGRVIVGEDFDLKSSMKILNPAYSFPNSVIPDMQAGKTPQAGDKVVTVMSNIGAALYTAGKKMGALLGVDIPGVGTVALTSPRAGLFKIGEGHFLPLMRKKGSDDNSSYANSIFRLATFMHEARHSDGNAESLGFLHAICPSGTYEGYNACDYSSNGPYTVGATFLKSATNLCDQCSEGEKEALRNLYMDSFSRIIPEPSSGSSDAATLAKANSILQDSCNLLRQLKAELPDACNAPISAAVGSSADNTTAVSKAWDDTPEIGPAQ